ncbi:cytochrome P450 [Coprinopsis sp. MPI-PUGE-AT-0042]|nr:cytochrome P450 [Coprinopsis sp. MPI-PUGE-AT-0042]
MLAEFNWSTAGQVVAGLLFANRVLNWALAYAKHRSLRSPPGPKGYPILGVVGQMPHQEAWRVYDEWRKEFGDVIYFELLGKGFLVLNSVSSINDLLSSRANIYSDRIWSPATQIAGSSKSMLQLNYGQEWRDQRKAFHRMLGPGQISQVHPIIEEEIQPFLASLVEKPNGYRNSMRMYLGTVILRVTYGESDPEYNRKLIALSENITAEFLDIFSPGRMLVSVLPILRFVPSWFPGAGWKRRLERYANMREAAASYPLKDTAQRLKSGLQKGTSMASELIQDLPEPTDPSYQYQYDVIKNAAAIAYLGGADTTFSSGIALLLALAMHPEVQRKAQQQIDEVVGAERLVRFEDLASLPYLQAIIKEVGRWHTPIPLNFPHGLREDDSYNGYHIPAKTTILANSWAVMHDPQNFDSPMEFMPERYLNTDGTLNNSVMEPEDAAFGYGRRICPGRYLSTDSLTYMAANILACFNIKPGRDRNGNPVPLELKPTSGIVSNPAEFPCEIEPRSQAHKAMLTKLQSV